MGSLRLVAPIIRYSHDLVTLRCANICENVDDMRCNFDFVVAVLVLAIDVVASQA